jgi:hypothetical protein
MDQEEVYNDKLWSETYERHLRRANIHMYMEDLSAIKVKATMKEDLRI